MDPTDHDYVNFCLWAGLLWEASKRGGTVMSPEDCANLSTLITRISERIDNAKSRDVTFQDPRQDDLK